MEKKEKRSLGQELAIELGGDVLGMGAGVLVGGVALGLIENIPGIGKPMKLLLKIGAYGLELATYMNVRNEAQEYISTALDSINDLKKIFAPKKPVAMTEEVEAKAEVK